MSFAASIGAGSGAALALWAGMPARSRRFAATVVMGAISALAVKYLVNWPQTAECPPPIEESSLVPIPQEKNALFIADYQSQIDQIQSKASRLRATQSNRFQKEFQALSREIDPAKGLTVIPCAGMIPHIYLSLFPDTQEFLLIDQAPFGSKWPFYEKACTHFQGKDDHEDLDLKKDMESCHADGIGFAYLNKLIAVGGKIEGVYFFDLTLEGEIAFQDPNDLGAPRDHALIVLKDKNGKLKKFWYLKQDLVAPSPHYLAFCDKMKGKMGNVFIKAVYDTVRMGPGFQKILESEASLYISDREENMIHLLPSNFPETTTRVIDTNQYIPKTVPFCYGRTLCVASQLLPFGSESDQKRLKTLRGQAQSLFDQLLLPNPEPAELLALFSKSTRKQLADIKNDLKFIQIENFKTKIEMEYYFDSMRSEILKAQNALPFFDRPVNAVSSQEALRNPLLHQRWLERTPPQEIWRKIGLEDAYLATYGNNAEEFWNEPRSMLEIHRALKTIKMNS